MSQENASCSPPSSKTACEICNEIHRVLKTPHSTWKILFDSGQVTDAARCIGHQQMFERLWAVCQESTDQYPTVRSDAVWLSLERGDNGLSGTKRKLLLELSQKRPAKFQKSWLLQFIQDDDLSAQAPTAKILDAEWIDLDLAKLWKQRCLSQHENACALSNGLDVKQAFEPTLLVDTQQNCLISGNGLQASYVALSYVWGKALWLRAEKKTLSTLLVPGSLESPSIRSMIAPTILHAMEVTRRIDERYMWVDALCIVQDDEPDRKLKELNMMGEIYRHATVTIVVADADTSKGLQGIENASQARCYVQLVLPFCGGQLIEAYTDDIYWSMRDKLKLEYMSRGWTYQEYELSQRKLIFQGNTIHWSCRSRQWHEDGMAAIDYEPSKRGVAEIPDLQSWDYKVQEYNSRNLSFDQDALPAILGMLHQMDAYLPGGFLYGLPIIVFDLALCWRGGTSLGGGFRRRRYKQINMDAGTKPLYALPSWSWVGWQGPTTTLALNETVARCLLRPITEHQTYPITTWYASRQPHDRSRLQIRSTWFAQRESLKADLQDPQRTLPTGWSQNLSSDVRAKRPDSSYWEKYGDEPIRYLYTHPKYSGYYFLYPIPLYPPTKEEATPSNTDGYIEQLPYISCQTQGRKVLAYRRHDWRVRNALEVVLKDNSLSEAIGKLYIDEQLSLEGFNEDHNIGTTIEVVTISRRVVKNGTRLYNVLWVEWDNSVAFRKGLGEIDQRWWDAQEGCYDVNLVLG